MRKGLFCFRKPLSISLSHSPQSPLNRYETIEPLGGISLLAWPKRVRLIKSRQEEKEIYWKRNRPAEVMVVWKVWHDCCKNQNQDAQKPNRGAPNPFIHMLLDLPSLISLSHSLRVWPSLMANRTISPSPTMIRAPLFFRENRPFPSLSLSLSPVVCSATLLRSRNTTVNTLLSLLFIFTVSIGVCVCVCVVSLQTLLCTAWDTNSWWDKQICG